MKLLLSLLFVLGASALLHAQTYSSPGQIPNPKTNSDGFVSDPVNYISAEDEIKINELITEVRDSFGYEIAVVIVPSIGGKDVLPFATDLGNLWKVGKNDQGVVLLVAVEDRNMAIATGYEAEGHLTDLITQEIQQEEIKPYFKTGDYSFGVLNGVQVMRDIIFNENLPYYVEDLRNAHANNVLWEKFAIGAALLLLILTIVVSSKSQTYINLGLILAGAGAIAVVSYYVLLKKSYTIDIIQDIFYVLSFIAIAVNAMIVLKAETQKVWPYAVYMSLVVPIPLIGLYLFGFKTILLVYLVGAGIIFSIFLILYVIALFIKDPYRKYHTIKLFKLDVFGYIFPLPMFIVDMMVENLLENWRNQVRFSTKTGLEMRKLSEEDDNKFLKSGEISEEKIKSVDYDVWVTDEKDDFIILKYTSWFSKYSSCPSCKYKTWYLVYDHTISAATYSSSGVGEKKKACAHCSHQSITRYTIPQLQRSSSGGGSGGSSGGGGSFGGGSFGGGGSSSSW